jgi:hypothetical protein
VIAENSERGRGPWFTLLSCVTMFWTIALLVILAISNDFAVVALGAIPALLSAIASIMAVMEPKPSWSKLLKWLMPPPKVVLLILAIDVAGTALWLAWPHYQGNQPINAVSQIFLKGNKGLLPGKGTAIVDITIKQWRKNATVTLESEDHRPELGTCRPGTKFQVTSEINGNPSKHPPVSPGEPFAVGIPPLTKNIRLYVTVFNAHEDNNCAIDLSVSGVMLTND